MKLLEFVLGAFLVGVAVYDVFQSVVVPRWTSRTLRIAPYLSDFLWPRWKTYGFRLPAQKREDFLATFAPLTVMLALTNWVLVLILGYGLMLHALRDGIKPVPHGLGEAAYLAGTSLFTIGFGDVVATSALARIVVLMAGASGLAVVALVISLTFTLYDSFKRREVLILALDARAGTPPSGVTLLETYAQFNMIGDLDALFGQWELWAADVLESHLAYPVLPFFRSSHDSESWVSALGAVLDAATLMLTAVQTGNEYSIRSSGAAHMMYGLGCHFVTDLSHYFNFRFDLPVDMAPEIAFANVGVERGEFETARRRLQKAGYQVCNDDQSWLDFARHRAIYARSLNELAKYFATPPTQWIGDRSLITHLHRNAGENDE